MKEIWKSIKGYDGYMVSSIGRVSSSLRKKSGHILIQCDDGRGYCLVGILKGQKKHTKRVHRLVAEAFLKKDPARKEVNHKDGNKKNNNISNLEWATRQENIQHCVDNKLQTVKRGDTHGMSKLVLDLQTGIYYNCGREASEARGYNYYTLLHKLSGSKRNNTSMIYV